MVTEGACRTGVGRALVETVRSFAREPGISPINLMVLANNRDAIAAYRAMGFDVAILHLKQTL